MWRGQNFFGLSKEGPVFFSLGGPKFFRCPQGGTRIFFLDGDHIFFSQYYSASRAYFYVRDEFCFVKGRGPEFFPHRQRGVAFLP